MKDKRLEQARVPKEQINMNTPQHPEPQKFYTAEDISVIVEDEVRRLSDIKPTVTEEVKCGCHNEYIIGIIAAFTFSLLSLFFLIVRRDRHFNRGLLTGVIVHTIFFLIYLILVLVGALSEHHRRRRWD